MGLNKTEASTKKEELCLRMELLAEVKSPERANAESCGVTIAEQLKLAFESNFITTSNDSKSCNQGANWKNSLEEAKKIKKMWNGLEETKDSNNKLLELRFKQACEALNSQIPKSIRD